MPHTTATSRVLQCPELCRLICEHIGIYDKRTLIRLSLSCRRFMEPALDVLWYKLDNFAPLVLCMAGDLYQEVYSPDDGEFTLVSNGFLPFQRSMVASDWERFAAAATRVRILNHVDFWGEMCYRFDLTVFRSLVCAAQGRTGLLPRLQQLTWETSDNDLYPYIFLFLSPTITNLTVYITTGDIASDRVRFSLLTSLVSQCPNVRSVELESLGITVHSWRDLFSGHSSSACALFSLWACLCSLTLNHVDLSTLTGALAGLPVLTTLKIHDCRAIDPLSPSTVTGFPMLQYLGMYGSDVDCFLRVLKRMFCTPLVELDLQVVGASREFQYIELFSILPNGISHDTLAIVSIQGLVQDDSEHPVPTRFQIMSPLLQFRRISHLAYGGLAGGSALDLDDNDVACIAQAWPCLTAFSIRPTISMVPSRLTLRALIPFVKYCPKLETLSIKINATIIDDYEEKPGKGLYGGRLQKLNVFDSPIDDPARVAAFLSDIFPNVRKIYSTVMPYRAAEMPVVGPKWDEVERLIPVFAAVRRQEAGLRK